MPDIASSDVTYTRQALSSGDGRMESSYKHFKFLVEFGDGALTYPAGGVPLDTGKLGCPNHLIELHIMEPEAGNGLVYKYDESAATVRIYEGDYAQVGDAPLVELDSGTDAPAAADLMVKVVGW